MNCNLYTPMQLVFLCSKVNGNLYLGDLMPACPHEWPENTWLQRRREEVRRREAGESDE